MGWNPRSYIPSFVEISLPVLEEKVLKGFYHIWAWRPSRSCDPDAAIKLSFPLPKETPHKILFLIGQEISEKKMFEIVDVDDGRRTPDHWYTILGKIIKGSPNGLYHI